MRILKPGSLKLQIAFILGAAILFSISQPALAGGNEADKWQFRGAIIPWAASIKGTTATGADIDIGFDDIVENLNIAMMGNLEARKNKWVFFFDAVYLDMESDSRSEGRVLAVTEIGLEAWSLTPSVGYTVLDSDKWRMDLLAGARYFYLDVGVDLETTPPLPVVGSKASGSDHVWDGIVGVRGKVHLTKHWNIPFYMDVGAGDSDLTWQVFSGLGYKFEKFTFEVGYRYLTWDWDENGENSAVLKDLTVHGPMIGFKFAF